MLQALCCLATFAFWPIALAGPVNKLTEVGQLHGQYYTIFPNGNRNAASHRWVRYILERSHTMSEATFRYLMSGYCPVSGSPVTPRDGSRWRLTLDKVGGGKMAGMIYYCCWPCICDTQDFIKVDTKTITTADGSKAYNFLVIGNPCEDAEMLKPWQQSAPDASCNGTHLDKAVLSDHGNVIIGMFFEMGIALHSDTNTRFNNESLVEAACVDRASQGYRSGMGQIFRGVAAITNVSSTLVPVNERKSVPQIVEAKTNGFFIDSSDKLSHNPDQRNYGVSIFDIDSDGKLEAFVAGYRAPNLALKWDHAAASFVDLATDDPVLQDSLGAAIGVSACDVDEDGYEELYILNTDAYSGQTTTSDLLIDSGSNNVLSPYKNLFLEPANKNQSNYVAGRSSGCLDRHGDGRYGIVVANYGGPFKLYELNKATSVIADVAPSVGMNKTTGGRSVVMGPIISNRMDVFANNEGWADRRLNSAEFEESSSEVDSLHNGGDARQLGHSSGGNSRYMERPNFFFLPNASTPGSFDDVADAVGLLDIWYTGRGTALLDSNGDGKVDIVYGNWNAYHRLYVQKEIDGCIKFVDEAPDDMLKPSPIRTVIVADWDNDGYEEIFFNNIPGDNRLFRKLPEDSDWTQVDIGDAIEPYGYGTGAAVGDFDEDGQLELLVSHGELGPQPLTYYKPRSGNGNNWLRVFPKTSHDAPARGAMVVLSAGGRQQLRVIDSGSGYLCQMEPVAHFGLGSLSQVDWVTVTWPDGAKFTFQPTSVNSVYTIPRSEATEIVPATQFTLEGHCLKRTTPADSHSPPKTAPRISPQGERTGDDGQTAAMPESTTTTAAAKTTTTTTATTTTTIMTTAATIATRATTTTTTTTTTTKTPATTRTTTIPPMWFPLREKVAQDPAGQTNPTIENQNANGAGRSSSYSSVLLGSILFLEVILGQRSYK